MDNSRTERRKGRPPDGISPADLPKPILEQAYRLTVFEGRMASRVYRALALHRFGVKLHTFRLHIRKWKKREAALAARHNADSTRETPRGAARALFAGFKMLGVADSAIGECVAELTALIRSGSGNGRAACAPGVGGTSGGAE